MGARLYLTGDTKCTIPVIGDRLVIVMRTDLKQSQVVDILQQTLGLAD